MSDKLINNTTKEYVDKMVLKSRRMKQPAVLPGSY